MPLPETLPRVLMVSDVYFPRVNGVSTSIQTFRRDLAALGCESVLIAPAYPAARTDEPGILPDQEYFRHAKRWDGEIHPYGPFDQIQLAIGQGSYLGTPLQLANAYAAIGNGGKLWTPRIVVAARLPDGTLVERNRKQLRQRISVSRRGLTLHISAIFRVSSRGGGLVPLSRLPHRTQKQAASFC